MALARDWLGGRQLLAFNIYMGKDYDRLEDEGSTERKLFCLGHGASKKRTAGYTKLVHSAAWMIPTKLSSLLAFICLWNMWRAEKCQILYVREDVEACYTVQSPSLPLLTGANSYIFSFLAPTSTHPSAPFPTLHPTLPLRQYPRALRDRALGTSFNLSFDLERRRLAIHLILLASPEFHIAHSTRSPPRKTRSPQQAELQDEDGNRGEKCKTLRPC